MTKEQARDELIAGSQGNTSRYVTVLREVLLLALGVPEQLAEASDDDRPHSSKQQPV